MSVVRVHVGELSVTDLRKKPLARPVTPEVTGSSPVLLASQTRGVTSLSLPTPLVGSEAASACDKDAANALGSGVPATLPIELEVAGFHGRKRSARNGLAR